MVKNFAVEQIFGAMEFSKNTKTLGTFAVDTIVTLPTKKKDFQTRFSQTQICKDYKKLSLEAVGAGNSEISSATAHDKYSVG